LQLIKFGFPFDKIRLSQPQNEIAERKIEEDLHIAVNLKKDTDKDINHKPKMPPFIRNDDWRHF